jgi:enoyl-CoA hydratase/carnithine racemase
MADNADIGGQSTTPRVNVADGRAVVRLNRPRERNRLEPVGLAVLRETFDRVDADLSICALVATGTGKSFSSGFDIGALADRLAGKLGRRRRQGRRRQPTFSARARRRPEPPACSLA